jgi:hypothetical protein
MRAVDGINGWTANGSFPGDWNFVEKRQDKSRNNMQTMTMEEKRLFENFTTMFDVHDHFLASSRVRYSWDNRRRDGGRNLARLDRIYLSKEISVNTAVTDYAIMGDNSASDHLPVKKSMLLETTTKRHSTYVMNARFMKVDKVKEMICGRNGTPTQTTCSLGR